jgi:hypothetical protein
VIIGELCTDLLMVEDCPKKLPVLVVNVVYCAQEMNDELGIES